MEICIYASDLSVITGHNKFKSENEIILKLWEKNFPEDYSEILSKINLNEKIDISLIQETSEDYIKRVAEEYNLKDIEKHLVSCKQSKDTIELNKSKEKVLKTIKNVPIEKKKVLRDCLTSKINTDFGIKNENSGLKKYIEISNENVKLFDKFIKRTIFKTPRFKWSIGGRIDGINEEETTVIEIKNRVHKLFHKLRDYEKIQIFAYMFILNKNKSKLVECFKKKNECDINIIDVEFDKNFWENNICVKIESFIKKFQKFLNNDELKKQLLLDSF